MDGDTVRYQLIPEQPATLGEPDGRISPRLRQIAKIFKKAGFNVALNRRMDDWLKTHAMLVTVIAGAIYLADGSTITLAKSRESVRTLVRGLRQGFGLLRQQASQSSLKTLLCLSAFFQSYRNFICDIFWHARFQNRFWHATPMAYRARW